jgi:hypothetical protein
LASKELNCNENGCSTSALHISDCNTNDNATLDVPNADCYEDGNPTSPLVLKSLREDMMLEEGAACTSLDQSLAILNTTACATINPVSHEVNVDIRAIGGDTDKEHADKESLSLIPTSPQTPTSFFFGKLMYVLKEEDTNIIRGIPQIYNDNRNIKQQMATG